jgi:tryptophan synthase alpha chain
MNDRLKNALAKTHQISPQNQLGTGLVTYLMAGDPNPETTLRRLKGLAQAGVDVLELGIPFSDPMADGPVIQAAGLRALQGGMDLKGVLELVQHFREENQMTPVLLMSYLNPILNYGYDDFLLDAVRVGVDGLILPDLPWVESAAFRQRADQLVKDELVFIPMIAQTSLPDHVQALSRVENGFAYVLSRNGITGGEAAIPAHILDFIHSLKAALFLPRFVGFGIQSSDQVAKLSEVCNGVIVGSALVKRFAEIDALNLNEKDQRIHELEVYSWIEELRCSAGPKNSLS